MNEERNQNYRVRTAVCAAILSILVAGCDNAESLQDLSILSFPTGYASLEADFCTSAPVPAKQKLKYLFILDHSASNKPGFALSPEDITDTDADGGRRYGPLVQFIRDLTADPNNITSFALINFNDQATQIGTNSGFENSQSLFETDVVADWVGTGSQINPSPRDQGFTDFNKALLAAKTLIENDARYEALLPNNPVKSTYQVMLVTDGIPTIATSNGGTATQSFDADLPLEPTINSILNLKSDLLLQKNISSITLNTAYYYNTTRDDIAVALLQEMADAGSGRYLEFASGQRVLYQQFTPPVQLIRNQLVDVFIDNLSASYWDDGRFYGDQDGDGLPDFIEAQYGSNLNLKDSDGNGVSDLVEFRTKGAPCSGANCSAFARDNYTICDGFSPMQQNNTVIFPSSTTDGLNDCEKFLLGANRNSYSTNGSFIPDFLAFKNSISLIAGTETSSTADPFGDGLTNYEKLKLGYPVQISNRIITYDFKPRQIMLTSRVSSSVTTDCYHLSAEQIAVSSPNDVIQILIAQNRSVIEDKPFLLKATKRINKNNYVSFLTGDFR